jgi:hypothetical protein
VVSTPLVITDDCAHAVLLAHGNEHSAARTHVIKRRVQMVHPKAADSAERSSDIDHYVRPAVLSLGVSEDAATRRHSGACLMHLGGNKMGIARLMSN